MAKRADLLFGRGSRKRFHRIVDQAMRDGRCLAHIPGQIGRSDRQLGQALVGKAHGLDPAQALGIAGQAVGANRLLGVHDLLDPLEEPGIIFGDRLYLGDTKAFAQRLCGDQQAIGRWDRQRRLDLVPRRTVQRFHAIQAGQAGLQPPERLLEAFVEAPADRHHLADGLHGR